MMIEYIKEQRKYCFVRDADSIKPIPIGVDRETYFVCREDARDAAKDAGYWMDGDSAREH
jgi:hypothetical protein